MGFLGDNISPEDLRAGLDLARQVGARGDKVIQGPSDVYVETSGDLVLHATQPLRQSTSIQVLGQHIVFESGSGVVGVANLRRLAELDWRTLAPSSPHTRERILDDLGVVAQAASSVGIPLGDVGTWLRNIGSRERAEPVVEYDAYVDGSYIHVNTGRSEFLLPVDALARTGMYVNKESGLTLNFDVRTPRSSPIYAHRPGGVASQRKLPKSVIDEAGRYLPSVMSTLKLRRELGTSLEGVGNHVGGMLAGSKLEDLLYRATRSHRKK